MDSETSSESAECPICLQPVLYPVKLPCGHQFCYLCVKGIRTNPVAAKSCAMCRQPFSIDQLEQSAEIKKDCIKTKHKWFYEGKTSGSGFWAFDERSNMELENAYSEKKEKIVISIAGFNYCVDFLHSVQYPLNHPERIRKIKRSEEHSVDNSEFKIKGIAGLRVSDRTQPNHISSKSDANHGEASGSSSNDNDELSRTLSESLRLGEDS